MLLKNHVELNMSFNFLFYIVNIWVYAQIESIKKWEKKEFLKKKKFGGRTTLVRYTSINVSSN